MQLDLCPGTSGLLKATLTLQHSDTGYNFRFNRKWRLDLTNQHRNDIQAKNYLRAISAHRLHPALNQWRVPFRKNLLNWKKIYHVSRAPAQGPQPKIVLFPGAVASKSTDPSPRKAILTHPEWTNYLLVRCELRSEAKWTNSNPNFVRCFLPQMRIRNRSIPNTYLAVEIRRKWKKIQNRNAKLSQKGNACTDMSKFLFKKTSNQQTELWKASCDYSISQDWTKNVKWTSYVKSKKKSSRIVYSFIHSFVSAI